MFDSVIFRNKAKEDAVRLSNNGSWRRRLIISRGGLAIQRLVLIMSIIIIWEMISGRWIDPFYISSPGRIIRDLAQGFGPDGTLWADTGITLLESGVGLALGMLTGLMAALLFLESEWLDKLLEPMLAVLNAIPRPALAPLAVLWLGLSIWSKIFVAWSLVFFVVFYNAYEGGKAINPNIPKALRVMGAGKWTIMRYVTIPAVAAWVFAAFKLSVAYALIGAIVGEFVGAIGGLGYQLVRAQGLLNTDRVFTVLIVTGAVAWAALSISSLIEHRVLRWRGDER